MHGLIMITAVRRWRFAAVLCLAGALALPGLAQAQAPGLRAQGELVDPHVFRACADPRKLVSLQARAIARDMVWVCYVPEPPSHTEATLGLIIIAWKVTPSAPLADAAVTAIEAASGRIVSH